MSAGLGVYFAVQSQHNQSAADGYRSLPGSQSFCFMPTADHAATCTAWNNNVQAQGRDAILSDVLYVAGGALAIGAVLTWFLWPTDAKTGALVVAPVVDTAGAGVRAVGRF